MPSLKELRQIAREIDLDGMILGRCDYCEMVDLAGKKTVDRVGPGCGWCGRGKVTALAESPVTIRRWLKGATTTA